MDGSGHSSSASFLADFSGPSHSPFLLKIVIHTEGLTYTERLLGLGQDLGTQGSKFGHQMQGLSPTTKSRTGSKEE